MGNTVAIKQRKGPFLATWSNRIETKCSKLHETLYAYIYNNSYLKQSLPTFDSGFHSLSAKEIRHFAWNSWKSGWTYVNLASSVARRVANINLPSISESEDISITSATKAISVNFNVLLFLSQIKFSRIWKQITSKLCDFLAYQNHILPPCFRERRTWKRRQDSPRDHFRGKACDMRNAIRSYWKENAGIIDWVFAGKWANCQLKETCHLFHILFEMIFSCKPPDTFSTKRNLFPNKSRKKNGKKKHTPTPTPTPTPSRRFTDTQVGEMQALLPHDSSNGIVSSTYNVYYELL